MVIVKLIGGLGNQLFQYATARRIAEINNAKLKLDISGFNTYKLHAYGLDNFNISTEITSENERKELLREPFLNKCSKKLFNRSLFPSKIIHEKYFHFDSNILSLPGNIYLDGYWQSEKYFLDIEDIIRQELTVKTKPDLKDIEIAEHIKNHNSVCLHIRRGDYVNNPTTNQFHGTCSLQYYQSAVKIIGKNVSDPYYYIFSDDIEWVKENLKLEYPMTFITNSSAKNYEDIRLMSFCKHHIIANSTFSWWGAWLGKKPGQMVFAPKRWLINEEYNTNDLIPENWKRI